MPTINTENRNKYALITGATSGFGYELAKLFAKDGYSLVLVARTEDRLQEVTDELKLQYDVEVTPVAKDLFVPAAAKEVYDKTKEMGITINVLVNDAGQGEYGKFWEYDIDRDIDLIQLNITSVVSLTKFYLKDMVARNEGKILQVASLLSKYPTPLMAVYGASKTFVLSFTEALNNELKDTEVTVTALMPGAADTDFFHKAGSENTVTYKETGLSNPEDVAKDGYEALMKGERRIISAGLKNKMFGVASNLMSDAQLAEMMRKQMEPSDAKDGKENITHQPSEEERAEIGKPDGDIDQHAGHVHEQHG